MHVTYGYGKNNNKKKHMRVVTRVVTGFRAGYRHVKVNANNKITLRRNTLLKIHYRNTSDI